MKKKSRKPFVLVCVSGGCAHLAYRPRGVEVKCIDWDAFDGRHATQAEITELFALAARVPNAETRAMLRDDVMRLKLRGTVEALEEMTQVEMADKKRRTACRRTKKRG